jgi:hypothetical protein
MRSHSLPWLLAAVSLLSGCSLLVDFEQEGQLCGDGGTCLPGYVCNRSSGVCLSPDGGTDGGTGGKSLCEDPAACPEPPEVR